MTPDDTSICYNFITFQIVKNNIQGINDASR